MLCRIKTDEKKKEEEHLEIHSSYLYIVLNNNLTHTFAVIHVRRRRRIKTSKEWIGWRILKEKNKVHMMNKNKKRKIEFRSGLVIKLSELGVFD